MGTTVPAVVFRSTTPWRLGLTASLLSRRRWCRLPPSSTLAALCPGACGISCGVSFVGGAVSPWAYGYLDPARLGRPLLLTDSCGGPSTLVFPRGSYYVPGVVYSQIELLRRVGHAQLVVRPDPFRTEPLINLDSLISDGLVKVVSDDSMTRHGNDIVQCECGSVARGADNNDMRCVEHLSPDDFAAGRTLCPHGSADPPIVSLSLGVVGLPRVYRIRFSICVLASILLWTSMCRGGAISAFSFATQTRCAIAIVKPVVATTTSPGLRKSSSFAVLWVTHTWRFATGRRLAWTSRSSSWGESSRGLEKAWEPI